MKKTVFTHAPVPNQQRFWTVRGSAPLKPRKKEAMAVKPWSFTVLTLFVLSGVLFAQAQDLQLKIFKVKGSLQSLYTIASDLKSAQGKVSIDKNTNSLIVVDYPAVLERIEGVVAQLDIPEKMVEVKVLVADADNVFFNTIGISSGQVVIPQGEFEVIVHSLNASRSATIRSQMMVKTLSNHPAQIQVSEDEIFGHIVTRYNDGTEVISPLRQAVGDFLEVLPTVNGDGTITIIVRPSSSSLTHHGLPQEKTILTQVVLRSGDTVAIGGIESAQEEIRRQGVAVPGVSLSKTKARAGKKVAMFLTATVMQ